MMNFWLIQRMQRNATQHYSSTYIFHGVVPGEPGSRFQVMQIIPPHLHESPMNYGDYAPDWPPQDTYGDVISYIDGLDNASDFDLHADTPIVYIKQKDGTIIRAYQTRTDDGRDFFIPFDEPPAQPLPVPSPQPPIYAEFLLHLFLKRDEQDAIIGDLIERYSKKYERFGERRAKLWFYWEVIRSLWLLIKRAFIKTSGLIAFGEWIRRHIS